MDIRQNPSQAQNQHQNVNKLGKRHASLDVLVPPQDSKMLNLRQENSASSNNPHNGVNNIANNHIINVASHGALAAINY